MASRLAGCIMVAMLILLAAGCERPPRFSPAPPPTATTPPAVPTATATPSPTPSPAATATPTMTATRSPVPTATPTNTPRPLAIKVDFLLVVRGPADAGKVAFTFDMGSELGSTMELLDFLKNNDLHATFFVTGMWVERNKEALKAIVAGGHELGNHSYTHPDFTAINADAMADELGRTEQLVKSVSGVSTRPFWRPPFGAYNGIVLRVAAENGYKSIYWTLDSSDWREDSTASSVSARVLKYTEAGTIVVMHGAVKKTVEAMPAIVEGLRDRGYHLTNLSGLLAQH